MVTRGRTVRPFHGFALLTLGIAAACASVSPADSAATETVEVVGNLAATEPGPAR